MDEDRRAALNRVVEDNAARIAAIGVQRMRMDAGFRKRYGQYLRNEIDWAGVLAGESHEAWYNRVVRMRQEGS